MTHNNFIYIAVMALVSYAIRVLPLTLIRKPIKNQFIQSFLYYVPYVTLAVMTFPAIVEATQSPVAGAVALVVGILAAWFGASLFQVSVACCAVVFVIELFLYSFFIVHLHTARIIILLIFIILCKFILRILLSLYPVSYNRKNPRRAVSDMLILKSVRD